MRILWRLFMKLFEYIIYGIFMTISIGVNLNLYNTYMCN